MLSNQHWFLILMVNFFILELSHGSLVSFCKINNLGINLNLFPNIQLFMSRKIFANMCFFFCFVLMSKSIRYVIYKKKHILLGKPFEITKFNFNTFLAYIFGKQQVAHQKHNLKMVQWHKPIAQFNYSHYMCFSLRHSSRSFVNIWNGIFTLFALMRFNFTVRFFHYTKTLNW